MKDLVHKLDRTFSLDPGVLYTFVSCSCEDDFPGLCELVHPYLTMAWLSQRAKTVRSLNNNEVCMVFKIANSKGMYERNCTMVVSYFIYTSHERLYIRVL